MRIRKPRMEPLEAPALFKSTFSFTKKAEYELE